MNMKIKGKTWIVRKYTKLICSQALISKLEKETLPLNNKNSMKPVIKIIQDLNTHFTREDTLTANKHRDACHQKSLDKCILEVPYDTTTLLRQ